MLPVDKPLAGRTVIVTRAAEQAEALAAPLRFLGAEVLLIPALEIQPMPDGSTLRDAVAHLENYDMLVVTSTNGADAIGREAQRQSVGLDRYGLQVYAVGAGTAERLEIFGAPARHVSEGMTALDLGRAIADRANSKRVLLVQGTNATNELAELLTASGAVVHRVDAYHAGVPATLRKMVGLWLRGGKKADAVTFTSPQIALNFFRAIQAFGESLPEDVVIASIGGVTTRALCELGHPPQVEASQPSMAALAQALGDFFASRA